MGRLGCLKRFYRALTSHFLTLHNDQDTVNRLPTKGYGEIIIETADKLQEVPSSGFSVPSITHIKCSYPLKVLVPKYAGNSTCIWVYPITFGGGLVGGDGIDMSINVKNNCCAVLTGQESTKVYKCEGGTLSTMSTIGQVEPGAFLCVLSDPVVCYKDANFFQNQVFHMSSHGNLVYLDWVLGGRVALEELWQLHSYRTQTDVYIDGSLKYRDNYCLLNTPAISAQQAMQTFQVLGSCIVLGQKLQKVSQNLTKKLGQKKSIGEVHDPSLVCSVSPLNYSVNDVKVTGIYVKFMAVSTSKAYRDVISHIVTELEPTIGGNPFESKY